ncbi:MAG TPA: sugar kinase [Clostridiales bacterium]|nr:sugar kinase [Clostridiales bacterium]
MYIGLDIGTSGTKASLINEEGRLLKDHQVAYGFCNTENGYRELNADEVWDAVKACLAAVGGHRGIRTITVSALGEAIIPMDASGRPLCKSISGTDIRGTQELEEIQYLLGRERLTDITGLNLSTIYSGNKILWLKKQAAKLYEEAWKIVTFQDYVIYRLTHSAVIDYSMASRTLLFDIGTNSWSEEILRALGIDRNKLSEPARGGSIVGTMEGRVAGELGLSPGIKVVVGTHDHICNAIGSGSVNYGDCANTVGTTEGLTALLHRAQLSTDSINRYQISCEPFVLPRMFNTVAWNNTSGILLKWFVQEFVREEGTAGIREVFRKLNEGMAAEPTGLLVLPHFSGAATPHMDDRSKGAILGLTLGTRREDIYKALMEGANYELALILDCLRKAGLQPGRLTATGGALSEQLLQIKADVLDMEVHTVESKQTGTLGGAILGAVAAGDFPTVAEAVEKMVRMGRTYEPESRFVKVYREKLCIYKELYQKLKEINHLL